MKIKEPNEFFRDVKSKITKNDILSVVIVFLLGIINNFQFFITEGVAPDALSPADFNVAGTWEIQLGRFGIKYINLLRFGLVNKFLIILISLAFLALAVVFITRTFEIKNKIVIVIVSIIVAIAPQFTETYFFIYCADAYYCKLNNLFFKESREEEVELYNSYYMYNINLFNVSSIFGSNIRINCNIRNRSIIEK